jgi:hypothetical protein
MSKTKRTKSKSAIQAVTVERGIWTTTIQAYRDVVAESRFPLDILVMVVYDQIVAAGGATFWQLKATSNGSFFLLPEKKEKTVEVISPNGYRVCVSVEISGLVATLLALKKLSTCGSAATAFVRLMEYAKQQPEFSTISSLMAGL